jgi:hypothetical protein
MGFDTEKSSVVMMFYRNTAIITVVGMLLLIGMGPREKLVPNSLVQALSTPVKSNNSKGTAPAKAANVSKGPNATATATATATVTAAVPKSNSTATATATATK